MATEVVVPSIGESITTVTLLSWVKKVGDEVALGDILAEVETDKSTVPVECPAKGVVLATLIDEGETVEIGRTLAIIGNPGEIWEPDIADQSSSGPVHTVESKSSGRESQPLNAAPTESRGGTSGQSQSRPELRAAPSARRVARELGIDIGAVAASLGGKRVTENHVREYASTTTAPDSGGAVSNATESSAPGHVVKLSRVRTIVAQRMTHSAHTIPQFSVSVQVEATALIAARALATGDGSKISVTALLIAAASAAIQAHPMVNARYVESGEVHVYDECNIGVAVESEDGLLAPVIHGAGSLSAAQISDRLVTLAERARAGTLGPDEQANATFTVSNLGSHGADQFVPMVVPGQAAILGVGAIRSVPVVAADHSVTSAPVFTAVLTADHRVIDGAGAMKFLNRIKQVLETQQEGQR